MKRVADSDAGGGRAPPPPGGAAAAPTFMNLSQHDVERRIFDFLPPAARGGVNRTIRAAQAPYAACRPDESTYRAPRREEDSRPTTMAAPFYDDNTGCPRRMTATAACCETGYNPLFDALSLLYEHRSTTVGVPELDGMQAWFRSRYPRDKLEICADVFSAADMQLIAEFARLLKPRPLSLPRITITTNMANVETVAATFLPLTTRAELRVTAFADEARVLPPSVLQPFCDVQLMDLVQISVAAALEAHLASGAQMARIVLENVADAAQALAQVIIDADDDRFHGVTLHDYHEEEELGQLLLVNEFTSSDDGDHMVRGKVVVSFHHNEIQIQTGYTLEQVTNLVVRRPVEYDEVDVATGRLRRLRMDDGMIVALHEDDPLAAADLYRESYPLDGSVLVTYAPSAAAGGHAVFYDRREAIVVNVCSTSPDTFRVRQSGTSRGAPWYDATTGCPRRMTRNGACCEVHQFGNDYLLYTKMLASIYHARTVNAIVPELEDLHPDRHLFVEIDRVSAEDMAVARQFADAFKPTSLTLPVVNCRTDIANLEWAVEVILPLAQKLAHLIVTGDGELILPPLRVTGRFTVRAEPTVRLFVAGALASYLASPYRSSLFIILSEVADSAEDLMVVIDGVVDEGVHHWADLVRVPGAMAQSLQGLLVQAGFVLIDNDVYQRSNVQVQVSDDDEYHVVMIRTLVPVVSQDVIGNVLAYEVDESWNLRNLVLADRTTVPVPVGDPSARADRYRQMYPLDQRIQYTLVDNVRVLL
jgi:hypothetical protein